MNTPSIRSGSLRSRRQSSTYSSRTSLMSRALIIYTILCLQAALGRRGWRDRGWKQLELFVGEQNLEKVPRKQWNSQVGQDRVILEDVFFGKKFGYFVDLAANFPVRASNTYSLERDFSWGGLCIEANPQYFWTLALRNCTLVGAVVGSNSSEVVTFHMPFGMGPGGYGGIVSEGTDNKLQSRKRRGLTTQFQTVSLSCVFEKMGVPSTVDYLSLDVEGAEEMVLSQFPFERYTILSMTVERPTDVTHHQLKKEGFTFVAMLGSFGDCMYVHRDIPNFEHILEKTRAYRILSGMQQRWAYVLQ